MSLCISGKILCVFMSSLVGKSKLNICMFSKVKTNYQKSERWSNIYITVIHIWSGAKPFINVVLKLRCYKIYFIIICNISGYCIISVHIAYFLFAFFVKHVTFCWWNCRSFIDRIGLLLTREASGPEHDGHKTSVWSSDWARWPLIKTKTDFNAQCSHDNPLLIWGWPFSVV